MFSAFGTVIHPLRQLGNVSTTKLSFDTCLALGTQCTLMIDKLI
jgi:hypothetical protein